VASLLSSHLSRRVTLHIVSGDEYVAKNKKDNSDFRNSEEFLRLWATTYPALEAGECAKVDPLLETLLGREPKSFEESLKESLATVMEEGKGAIEQYAK
jgi:hypothetical protein